MRGVLSASTAPARTSRDAGFRAAGFVASSLDAWPGRRSAAVLISGCNLRCAYCCCPEVLGGRRSMLGPALVIGHLAGCRDAIAGVVVTGGEPTADPGLMGLLRQIRSLGIPVKIDTNGTFPSVLEALVDDRLVDFVALDVKATPDRYDSATSGHGVWERVHRSISILIESGIDHEFRTTCYPSALLTAELPLIARGLEGGARYAIQQFRPQRTLDPAASTVRPYCADALRRAALCCSVHLPTMVRGV